MGLPCLPQRCGKQSEVGSRFDQLKCSCIASHHLDLAVLPSRVFGRTAASFTNDRQTLKDALMRLDPEGGEIDRRSVTCGTHHHPEIMLGEIRAPTCMLFFGVYRCTARCGTCNLYDTCMGRGVSGVRECSCVKPVP